MSNITLAEIYQLTADAYGLMPADLRKPIRRTRGQLPLHAYARWCAGMLARRHTEASWKAIVECAGRVNGRDAQATERAGVARLEALAETDMLHWMAVAKIEEAIDELHERRCAEIPQIKGFEGLWLDAKRPSRHAKHLNVRDFKHVA